MRHAPMGLLCCNEQQPMIGMPRQESRIGLERVCLS
jgi:hypothetical protein